MNLFPEVVTKRQITVDLKDKVRDYKKKSVMKSNSSHSSRKGESRGKYVVDFLTMEGESNIQCETVHEMGYVPEDDSEETSVENAYTVS